MAEAEIFVWPEEGTLAYQIFLDIVDTTGLSLSQAVQAMKSLIQTLEATGMDPRALPYVEAKPMNFEISMTLPKERFSALYSVLGLDALGPSFANMEVTAGGLGFDVEVQTHPIGERHVKCKCEGCMSYAIFG